MARLRKEGWTQRIAERFGVSRQPIHQILKRVLSQWDLVLFFSLTLCTPELLILTSLGIRPKNPSDKCTPYLANRFATKWKFIEKLVGLILSLQGDKQSEELLLDQCSKSAGNKDKPTYGEDEGVLTAPSEREAIARFRALAREDGPLARYLFPRDPVRKDRCSSHGIL